MQITIERLNTITPYARNPRKNAGAIAKVKASLKEFGWQQPIVVDEDRVILAGHTRYQAALELGWTEAPVHIARGLTKAQAKAYRIADNRTAQEAEWDMDLLALEIEDLKLDGFDLDLTGFDADEIAGMLDDSANEDPPDSSAQEIDPDEYEMGHRCPRCGFEFDDDNA